MQVTFKIKSNRTERLKSMPKINASLIRSTVQASNELDESQARQLSFDLESAYNDFNKILHSS